jgi:hypothetical protein
MSNSLDESLFVVASPVEGVPTSKEHVHDNAASPDIDTLSVPLALSLLRGHKQDSPHFLIYVCALSENIHFILCRQPEICDLSCVQLPILLIQTPASLVSKIGYEAMEKLILFEEFFLAGGDLLKEIRIFSGFRSL